MQKVQLQFRLQFRKGLIYDLKWTIWLTMINNLKRSLLQGVPINLGIQLRFLYRLRSIRNFHEHNYCSNPA